MQAQVTGAPRRLAPITSRTFGRYRLERRIAYGGMAEILLATELRSGRRVALKRILPQYSSSNEFVQYFIHEGRLGQRLTHPNLVQTYEAGQVSETCYIALEYLRGATCIELLRAAAKAGLELPLGAAVRVVADAARGLHYAHTAFDSTGQPLGVVHRDVTPHNLFVCRDGMTKVLDFGIAKAASQLHHTRTGTIKGKFSYLAPEQIRAQSIDHRVDVFALGIVLHELLTLKPLFRGVNDADTLQRILTLEVPPPERVRRAVPPGLGAVALRALQRDRERRLPSAEALADSIEAVAEAECIDASHDVVAALLAELCPPPPEELEPDPELDFQPEPPSVRSASKERIGDLLATPAMALGATGSASSRPAPDLLDEAPELDVSLALEPVPGPVPSAGPDSRWSPSAPMALTDTVPNRPQRDTPVDAAPAFCDEPVIEDALEGADEDEPIALVNVVSRPPVAVGRLSGAAPSLATPNLRGHNRTLQLTVVVGVALLLVLSLWLVRRSPELPPPAPATVTAPPPPPVVAPRAEPPPPAPIVEAPPEARLRVQTDGTASFSVDGRSQSLAADGALHLRPGRHKVVVTSERLATPRSFELDVKGGEELTRSARSGRGRLKLAVTPWAEVQLDGRNVGTTPLSAVELTEGAHWVTLRNVELGANLKKRVVVHPDRETTLRVDLFGR